MKSSWYTGNRYLEDAYMSTQKSTLLNLFSIPVYSESINLTDIIYSYRDDCNSFCDRFGSRPITLELSSLRYLESTINQLLSDYHGDDITNHFFEITGVWENCYDKHKSH